MFAVGIVAATFVLANLVVALLARDLWYVAAVLLLAAPGFYILNRYPFAALLAWIVLAPFLMTGEGGGNRKIYWIIHRGLPLFALMLMLVSRWIGVRTDKLPKLGWPELMMVGYIVLTLFSIGFRSADAAGTVFYMFDHVVIPMGIYLLVRWCAPDEEDFGRLALALAFVVVSQALIVVFFWVAPSVLPSGWVGREDRGTGTLRHPNVYAVVLLFAGLYLTHHAQMLRDRPALRRAFALMLPLAAVMSVATLSRAAWLAAIVACAGLLFVYPRVSIRMFALGAVGLVAMFQGGLLSGAQDDLSARLDSERSALSRLPVVVASFRMIQASPAVGWGYENFDEHSPDFTSAVDGVFVPDRFHASHNFFLTLGAEGGLLGLGLYLGPAVWWLCKSGSGVRHLPETGFKSKKLIGVMWVAMAAQIVAYNFSNNRVAFGLGVWWLTLGLVATACDWPGRAVAAAEDDARSRVAAFQHHGAPSPPSER